MMIICSPDDLVAVEETPVIIWHRVHKCELQALYMAYGVNREGNFVCKVKFVDPHSMKEITTQVYATEVLRPL